MLGILPQAWIVLTAFVVSIVFNLFLTLFNQKYRRVVFKDSTQEIIMYFVSIFVMGIILSYSAQCSIQGSYVMPSCNIFVWIMTALVVVLTLWCIGCKVYKFLIKNEGTTKKTDQEYEDIEEQNM